MSDEARDVSFFDHPDMDRLAGLVFELAAQLHAERQRRLALETLLLRTEVLQEREIAALVEDDDFLAAARQGLDRSLKALMTVITERGDAHGPLRAEAPGGDGG